MSNPTKPATAVIEVPADVPTDLSTLDEVALLALRIVDQEQQQALSVRLIKADHDRDASYAAGAPGAELDQLKVVRAHIAAQLAGVVEHLHQVEVAILACRRPLIETAHNDARSAPAALRAEIEADVAFVLNEWAEIHAAVTRIEGAQRRANQMRNVYGTRCQELGTEPVGNIAWTITVPSPDRLERMAVELARTQRTVASLATRGLL